MALPANLRNVGTYWRTFTTDLQRLEPRAILWANKVNKRIEYFTTVLQVKGTRSISMWGLIEAENLSLKCEPSAWLQ